MLYFLLFYLQTLRLLHQAGLKESAEARQDGFQLPLSNDAKIFLLTKSFPNNLITVLFNKGLLLRKESFFSNVEFQKFRGFMFAREYV
jgi:hypothetical protein